MLDARDADWLQACRRATETITGQLAGVAANGERLALTGSRGEGGDRTLVLDAQAEAAVFAEFDALYAAGARFSAVSEERGEIAMGGTEIRVIVDPIDGSTNAKRGVPHYALSVAVADGPTMGDVFFAYVYDFGAGEEWTAQRGAGAHVNGVALDPEVAERMNPLNGRVELLGIESGDPERLAGCASELAAVAYRLRVSGAMSVALVWVGAARLDAMVTLSRCRAVDVAAAQLIVREGGGTVAFVDYDDPLGAPLDLAPHSRLVAARSQQTLERLIALAR